MKIIAIGDPMTVFACRAGGVSDGIPCRDAEEAHRALKEVLEHPEVGVVCVLDRYLREMAIPSSGGAYPVIIPIPGPEGAVTFEDAVSAAVRKVTGRQHLPEAEP